MMIKYKAFGESIARCFSYENGGLVMITVNIRYNLGDKVFVFCFSK